LRSQVFLDTSYLLALVRKKDSLHAQALMASQQFVGPFLTTDLVIIELANSLAAPATRTFAVSLIERIRSDRHTTVVPCSTPKMSLAFDLYKNRQDKSWGMIDCFSFVMMTEAGVRIALTFDEHFRQAGFEAPLLGKG
jgi:predicted nucleic acid-binding protein